MIWAGSYWLTEMLISLFCFLEALEITGSQILCAYQHVNHSRGLSVSAIISPSNSGSSQSLTETSRRELSSRVQPKSSTFLHLCLQMLWHLSTEASLHKANYLLCQIWSQLTKYWNVFSQNLVREKLMVCSCDEQMVSMFLQKHQQISLLLRLLFMLFSLWFKPSFKSLIESLNLTELTNRNSNWTNL